ncbi:MAG: SRPBCC family protein [Acinetobacter sp.]|nr:MAG: SRPBCC family protein [Acinetobacter sp.]
MKKQYINTLILIIMPSWASAQLITWTDTSPNALAPFQNNAQQVADLAGSDIFLYSHPVQNIQFNSKNGLRHYNNVQFSTAALVVNATPQQIYDTLKNYSGYVGLFPSLKKANIIESHGNISVVKYRVSIPTPIKILNFNEDAIIQHQLTHNSLSALLVDSPVQYGMSKIQWFALSPQKSLITITQWNDLHHTKGFLLNAILKAMPEVREAVPYVGNSFVMEALNLKFNGKMPTKVLDIGKVPTKSFDSNQYQQLIQLTQNTQQPVAFIHPSHAVQYQHGLEALRFTTSYQYFKTPPKKTQQLLQPMTYQTLFPRQIKKIDLIAGQAPVQDAFFQVRVGLGVINIPFNLRIRFSPIANGMNMYAVGGDLKFAKTRMMIQPYAQGSVWTMTTASKIDASAPFLLRAMRSLPYHDVLPSTAVAKVIHKKALEKLGL